MATVSATRSGRAAQARTSLASVLRPDREPDVRVSAREASTANTHLAIMSPHGGTTVPSMKRDTWTCACLNIRIQGEVKAKGDDDQWPYQVRLAPDGMGVVRHIADPGVAANPFLCTRSQCLWNI